MRRLIALVALAAAFAAAPRAEDTRRGAVTVSGAWVRATTIQTSAAYLTIAVSNGAGDTLVAAASPAAGRVELHTVIEDGGVMRMRPVASIAIARGRPAQLRPGGDHIMLMDIKAPLRAGDRLPLVLHFAKAGAVELSVPVIAGNAPPAPALPPHEYMQR